MLLPAAVKAGDLPEVERLIAAGAPLDERLPKIGGHDDDYTPLGLAARDGTRADRASVGRADATAGRALRRQRDFQINESGYLHEQMQSPQTIGYALTDSPAGQAAWIYEKYEQWTDHRGDPQAVLSRDEMLDNITLYWLTGTAASSARIYWESFRSYRDPRVEVPVGVSIFPRDIYLASRRWAEAKYPKLVHYNELSRGGHFAAWEQPELLAEEIRLTFRHMR